MATGTAPLLLVSMPQMADPNFAKTVVLLCDYTDQGALGLVVNRQLPEPASQLIKTKPPVRVNPELRLWMGGPVELQRCNSIHFGFERVDPDGGAYGPGDLGLAIHAGGAGGRSESIAGQNGPLDRCPGDRNPVRIDHPHPDGRVGPDGR